jgi:hypothetical protein
VSLAGVTARMLARQGRAMTLRRRVGMSSAFTDIGLLGRIRDVRPDELTGGVKQGDAMVVIEAAPVLAASGFAPPRKGDFIVADGRTWAVEGCETRFVGAAVDGYELHLRGGAV